MSPQRSPRCGAEKDPNEYQSLSHSSLSPSPSSPWRRTQRKKNQPHTHTQHTLREGQRERRVGEAVIGRQTMDSHPNGSAAAAPGQSDPQQQPPQPPPEEEELRDPLSQLSQLFYSGNPKHVLSGAGEGLGNVATGVSMGLASLVGATVAGSRGEGAWGGVKGFGVGLVGFAALTGYGAYTGCRQISRGVYNTPEAVDQASKGELLWDSNKEEWVRVFLEHELEALPATDDDIKVNARKLYNAEAAESKAEKTAGKDASAGEEAAEASSAPAPEGPSAAPYPGMNERGEVVDYYLFLGVARTASGAEIKRAFTRRALVMHPDKNPNDPNATARFQQLLQVYNVLSNEVTRAEYDRTGRVDADHEQADGANPIEEILALDSLVPLVGRLHFTTYFETHAVYDAEMQKELHRRRHLRIARNLCEYLDNEETGFASASFVLREAAATRTGPQIVTFIAESYHAAARQHLHGSSWVRELDSWYHSKVTSASSLLNLASSGVRTTYRAVRGEATDEDVLALLVAAVESDVRSTVLRACRLVLYDSSVSVTARGRRAKRLEQLASVAMEEVHRELASRETAAAAVTTNAP